MPENEIPPDCPVDIYLNLITIGIKMTLMMLVNMDVDIQSILSKIKLDFRKLGYLKYVY